MSDIRDSNIDPEKQEDLDIEEIKEEQSVEEIIEYRDLKEYKEQIEDDKISYERNVLEYKHWELKVKELVRSVKKTFENVNLSVENFIDEMNDKFDDLSDEDRILIENRIKGINMINKMSKNVIANGLNKISQQATKKIEQSEIVDDLSHKSEDEIRIILNENYSSITNVCTEKSNLINKYFGFVENSILPIIDGVDSGINFVNSSSNEIIKKEVLPEYLKLKDIFEGFLNKCSINRIKVNVHDKVDFAFVEILDVEETKDDQLDETVESIIRNGYEYLEDIYGTGHNYVLRQAQIVAFKLMD